MRPTGAARLAGVMGWPVAHSRSPVLHGVWLDRHGIDGAYVPLAVPPDGFARAFRALPDLGFRGVNVTVPHKEAALALCDSVDQAARAIGAVNTVTVQDGKLVGSNTDAMGFLANLRENSAWRADAGPALVLGAGGAARAVLTALADAGCSDIRLANRSRDRADALAARVPCARAVDWADRAAGLGDLALLVNTTALGMAGQPALDMPLDGLAPGAVVCDLVYAPLETGLLRAAAARGNPKVDGLGMLLHQAVPGFAAWFGVTPTVDADLRRAVLQGMA